ncbi:unnamed protein product [Tilletia laevis]|uniref:Uncharacterized protein n=1 Tax=Tilletia caries TaxID=13290 RepID=A0A177UP44_9BASI|nr:hypothetical protein CF336_g5004 [Tilletia laevis]KAE8258237.1 hypothetical protein A4X03_0g4439 [Tilletia caries]CAD6899157.1 unnamed protein product [Tilletia controversa]KAE8198070.1 hypothetical protein CF335_g4468 [Tilletia laevis]CAD6886401.1 unnamed protein product [Tilletia caries]
MASKLAASAACARSLGRSSASFHALGRRLGSAPAVPASSASTPLYRDTASFCDGRYAAARYSTAATNSAEEAKDDALDAEESLQEDPSKDAPSSTGKDSANRPPRRNRTLLLDPEDVDSEPTLQALERLRPSPYTSKRRGKSPLNSGEGSAHNAAEVELAARKQYWQKAARRVGMAFNRAQLLKIAREEMPVFSKSRRREGSSHDASVPRIDENLRKAEIIRRIMVHHWKMREPRASPSVRADVGSSSRIEKADVEAKPEPTEWLFYPLDIPHLYILLTALKDPLTEYISQFQARFFPAQQEVEVPSNSQADADPSSSSATESDETTAPAPAIRIQQGLQITAFKKSDLEDIKKWIDNELSPFQQTKVDLAPIYAAASHPISTEPQQLTPPAAMLKEFAGMSFSFLQPEAPPQGQSLTDTSASGEISALPFRITAVPDGLFRRRRYSTHPSTFLRQYAVEHRDQAGRPLFIYSPSSPSSSTAVADALGMSTGSSMGNGGAETDASLSAPNHRVRYALNPHHMPTPRPFLALATARARQEDLNEVLHATSARTESKQITARVGTSSAISKWRLERSMVSDALEGRGGLGFSLGYGVDLDSERDEAGQQQDENEGEEDESLSAVGQPALLLPPPALHGSSTTTQVNASRTAQLLGQVDQSTPVSDGGSDAAVQHTYAATFGHLRFAPALPFDAEHNYVAIQRARIHGMSCPTVPGSWPLSKLKRMLVENESPSESSPLQAFAKLQRPTFIAAIPPIALLPPDSVSNTLSAVKSGSAAGDAWTRLMARAFGDLSSSIISPGSRSSQRAKQPGAVLLEALKWMRSFKERSKSSKAFAQSDNATVPAQKQKQKPSEVEKVSKVVEPTREDIARFTYVPSSATDRSHAPGRRLVIEAKPRYDCLKDNHSRFEILRALWETDSSQADVLVPDASIDMRMSHAASIPLEPEALSASEQLRQFLSGESTGSDSSSNEVRPMAQCYNRALLAPPSFSLPLRREGTGDTEDIQMQLESMAVLSRTAWPIPAAPSGAAAAAAAGKSGAAAPNVDVDAELDAWLVEETAYLDGSRGDATPSMRVEWRTRSRETPAWDRLAQDLDLMLDVPFGVCKGRSSYTTI